MDISNSTISCLDNTTGGVLGEHVYRTAECVFSITLTVVGIIGNSHALVINVQRLKMGKGHVEYNPYIIFVISLAFLDMLSSTVTIPMDAIDTVHVYTPFSDGVCKFFRYIQFVIHATSVLHIVLISIHCWRQVCYPHSRQIGRKHALICCTVFNAFALLIAVIVLLLSGRIVKTIEGNTGAYCYIGENSDDPIFLRIGMGLLSIGFLVCLCIICTSYIALIVNRWRNRKERPDLSLDEQLLQKITTTLIILTVVFVIAYIPFIVIGIIKAVDKEFQNNLRGASSAAHGIFLRFPFINNVVNPFIYGLRDMDFRQRLLNIYPCLKKVKKEATELDSSRSTE